MRSMKAKTTTAAAVGVAASVALLLPAVEAQAAGVIHFHGVSTGTQSTVVVNAGNANLERTTHPEGTVDADIDPVTNTISNVQVVTNPIDTPILPGALSAVPLTAHVESSIVGTPVNTMASTGLSGVYDVTSQATVRVAVTILAGTAALTNPNTCYVDVPMNLAGTANTTTKQLHLAQTGFTIPSFPLTGCGLFGPLLTGAVSGSHNNADLNYAG